MATFAIDLISGRVYLFVPDFGGGGSGGTTGSTYNTVPLYSLLPSAGSHNNEIYVVLNPEGAYVLNRKDAGMYYSDGISWRRLGDTPAYFNSDNFQIYDGTDTSKGFEFVTSGISTSNFRQLTIQDSSGTIAYLTDLDGKVDESIFNFYTGTTAPNTYVSIISFTGYTATTELRLVGIEDDISDLYIVKMDKLTGHTNQVGFFDVDGQITGNTGMTYLKQFWGTDDVGTSYSGDTLVLDGMISGLSYISLSESALLTGDTIGLLHRTDKSLNYHTHIPATVFQLGEELAVLGVNKTGVLIPDGTPIMYGGNVTGNRPHIQPASGDTEENAFLTIGFATSDIANNEEGFVTMAGEVGALTTVSSYANGAILYLAITGGTTDIQPIFPDPIVRLGIVRNNHATQGAIGVKVDYFYDPTAYVLITDFNAYTASTQIILDGKQEKLIPLQLKDISGGTEVNTIVHTPIGWTTEEYSGTSLNFTGGSRIYILEDTDFNISYNLNVENKSNTIKNIGTLIRKNGTTDITPLSSASYSRNSTNDSSTNTMSPYKVALLNGDYIELIGFRIGSSGSVLTVPDGSWIKIEKI